MENNFDNNPEQRALRNFERWADGAPPEIRVLAEKHTAALVGFRVMVRRPTGRPATYRGRH